VFPVSEHARTSISLGHAAVGSARSLVSAVAIGRPEAGDTTAGRLLGYWRHFYVYSGRRTLTTRHLPLASAELDIWVRATHYGINSGSSISDLLASLRSGFSLVAMVECYLVVWGPSSLCGDNSGSAYT
jgi:hypothetical protein